MLVLLFIFATIDNAYLNVSDCYKSLLVVSSNFQMLKWKHHSKKKLQHKFMD